MLKMDGIQGRIGTPGALIRKSDKPSRKLTADEVRAIKPLLWKSKGDICEWHKPGYGKLDFTLMPLDDQFALISTLRDIHGRHEFHAYWITGGRLERPLAFLMESSHLDYEKGILSGIAFGRGIGDCIGGSTWVWGGTEFRHSRKWWGGLCRFIHAGGAWGKEITTCVIETKPAE
jgi:hypothetical protein